jgi:hypothetical protein
MKTRRSKAIAATNKLTKEDSDARKLILRNVANELFSLMQGTRKQCYGVIGLERRRARNIYPWMTGGMLDHQLMKLKRNQAKGVAVNGLLAIATIDLSDLQAEATEAINNNRTPPAPGGRPTGSTVEASKTLDDRKRKAFDDAATIYSEFKTRGRLPVGGLNKIIKRATLQNGLENQMDWKISAASVRSPQKASVRSQQNSGHLSNVNRGPASPLALAEPLLLKLCKQRSRMGQPLAQSEGTPWQDSRLSWNGT